jgi:hypothetical protein
MKTNTFKTALMAMAMAVISNVATAAGMNDMPTTTEASLYMVVSTAEIASSSSASANEFAFYVNASTTERVKAQSTDRYTHRFYADETAYIYVDGDGDTDLDLYVYDENGNLIDSDTDPGDTCLCRFTPKWTGSFTIKVKNLGRVYNEYRIRFVQ